MNRIDKGNYILEVSWGCPSDRYPLHGLFQFDQAKALTDVGEKIVFLALDMRSIRRWRKWGVSFRTRYGIPVCEYSFPYGPFSPEKKYRIQDRGFDRSMAKIERRYGKPGCVHFHGVMEAISGMAYCVERGIPYVITEHITPVEEGEKVHSRMVDAYAHASRIIAVSNRLAEDVRIVYGAHADAVIPNIVDLEIFCRAANDHSEMASFTGDADKQREHDEFVFITAARLVGGKGLSVLLNAFSTLPDTTRLIVMGDGPLKAELEHEAGLLGITDRVSFTGAYLRPEFAGRLQDADCFVLPSESETFGIVYVEAMAAGVPVIATKCGGPEDFVDESSGILVPVGDVGGLILAMKKMIDSAYKYDRLQISEKCRCRFSPDVIATQIKQVVAVALNVYDASSK